MKSVEFNTLQCLPAIAPTLSCLTCILFRDSLCLGCVIDEKKIQGGATHVDIACNPELVKLAISLTSLPVSVVL